MRSLLFYYFVVACTAMLVVGQSIDTHRLDDSKCKEIYGETVAAKTTPNAMIEYAIVERTSLCPQTLSVAATEQSLASIILHVVTRNNERSTAMMASYHRHRASNPGRFSSVTFRDYLRSLEALMSLEYPEKFKSSASKPTQTDDDSRSVTGRGDDSWSGILSLVPDVEQLAHSAGYEDFREQATLGMALSLKLSNLCESGTYSQAVKLMLAGKFLRYTFHDRETTLWPVVTSILRDGSPLVAHSPGDHAYVVIGFYRKGGHKILFAFDSNQIERGVMYGGRQMIESKLSDFKKDHPNMPFARTKYFDFLSTHKQYQLPGFCALEYNDEIRFSYFDGVSLDDQSLTRFTLDAMNHAADSKSKVSD